MTAHTVDAATKAALDATETTTRKDVEAIIAAARPHIAAEAMEDLRQRLTIRRHELTRRIISAYQAGDTIRERELAGEACGLDAALSYLADTARSGT